MERDMENKEWINDYELLKQVSNANPFTVPDGYFDNLAARIATLKNIKAFTNYNLNDGFVVPAGYFDELNLNLQSRRVVEDAANKQYTGFTVPDGYFEVLTGNIQARVAIEEVLKGEAAGFTVPAGYFGLLSDQIESRVAIEEALSQPAGFSVPEGYFEDLASAIQSRVAIEEAIEQEAGFTVPDGNFDDLASAIRSRIAVEELSGQETGLAVPEGYFDNLSSAIQSRIAVEELVAESADVFAVPDGYFDELQARILAQTADAGKVVALKKASDAKRGGIIKRLVLSTAFKYATAACVTIALGGGILLINNSNTPDDHQHSFLHKQLSTVPISDIKSYLQLNVDAGDTQQAISTEGSAVNDKDLKNALQSYADSVQ